MSLLLPATKLSNVTRLFLISFAILFFTYSALADFSATVVSVLDGDTIEVLLNHHLYCFANPSGI